MARTQPTKPLKMTAAEVRVALKARYPHPEFGLVFEVAQATGHNANRHVDAVVMDTWPSRGLALHAVEIKVSRPDFRREIKDPAKAEELARFCDYFWIAAPKGVVPKEEMPLAWGLIEVDETGTAVTSLHARQTAAQDIDRAFLAAVFRAASRTVDPATLDALTARVRREVTADFDKTVERAVADAAGRRTTAERHWHGLCDALGMDPKRPFYRDKELAKAVRMVQRAGAAGTYAGLAEVRGALDRCRADLDAALAELAAEEEGAA